MKKLLVAVFLGSMLTVLAVAGEKGVTCSLDVAKEDATTKIVNAASLDEEVVVDLRFTAGKNELKDIITLAVSYDCVGDARTTHVLGFMNYDASTCKLLDTVLSGADE